MVRRLIKTPSKQSFFLFGARGTGKSTVLRESYSPGEKFYYGGVFEHFIVAEIHRLASYLSPDTKLSFLKTKDDVEVDLVLERPGQRLCLIEIKSAGAVQPASLTNLARFADELGAEAYCLSQVSAPQILGNVKVMPWRQGLAQLFAHAGMDFQG